MSVIVILSAIQDESSLILKQGSRLKKRKYKEFTSDTKNHVWNSNSQPWATEPQVHKVYTKFYGDSYLTIYTFWPRFNKVIDDEVIQNHSSS